MRRSETIGGGSRLMLSFPAHFAPGDASCPDPKGLEHGSDDATNKLHSTRIECTTALHGPETGAKMATSATGGGAADISVAAAFSNGFTLLGRRTGEIVIVAVLLGSLPWAILYTLSQHLLTHLDGFLNYLHLAFGFWQGAAIGLIIGVVIQAIGITAAFGFIARIAIAAADNRDEPVARSLDVTLRRYPEMVVMDLIREIATWIGLVLLIVPGLILSVMWSLAAPAMVAEGLGPIAGLRRSAYLTRDVRWRVLGLALVMGIVDAVGNYLLRSVAGDFYGGKAELARAISYEWPIWYMAAMTVYRGAAIAITGSVFAALYVQLRNGKDGPQSDQLAEVFA
jgi:hypothetical protein